MVSARLHYDFFFSLSCHSVIFFAYFCIFSISFNSELIYYIYQLILILDLNIICRNCQPRTASAPHKSGRQKTLMFSIIKEGGPEFKLQTALTFFVFEISVPNFTCRISEQLNTSPSNLERIGKKLPVSKN